MEYNFKQVIENLLQDQRKTKKSLYDHLGLTAQGLDNKLKQKTISVVELESMANFFEISEARLVGMLTNKPVNVQSEDKSAFGSHVVESILEEIRLLRGQLDVKDQQLSVKDQQLFAKDQQLSARDKQIDRLMELALGKPSDVAADDRHDDPKIIVHPAFARRSETAVYGYEIA